MYIVKPNGNYNVVISDLNNLVISAGTDGKTLTDEEYKSSADTKRMVDAGYLTVTQVNSAKASKAEEKTTEPAPTAFVSHASETSNPSDVFVAHTENLKAKVAEDKIVAEEGKAKILDPVEVVELKQEESTEAVETQVLKEEVKEEAPAKSTTKASTSTKATTKKAPAKKAADTKKSSKA